MHHPPIQLSHPEVGVALIQFNRADRMNALDVPALDAAHALLDEVLADRGTRVIVLTGKGKGFCAGLDLKSMLDEHGLVNWSVEEAMSLQKKFAGLVQRLRETDVPVIAAVHGVAVGAGMALSLAADVRFGTPQTAFHVGAVKIGISAGECGISYHLPRLVGAGRAFELMLTGRPVLAQEALSMGLVSDLVPEPELMERAMACARSILALAPYSVTQTKRIMWRNLDAPDLASALELENQVQVLGLMTDDFSEAVQAFVHKRPPRFSTP